MIQEIIKIGSLAGLIIPQEFLDELEIKIGDKVKVYVSKDKRSIIVRPLK